MIIYYYLFNVLLYTVVDYSFSILACAAFTNWVWRGVWTPVLISYFMPLWYRSINSCHTYVLTFKYKKNAYFPFTFGCKGQVISLPGKEIHKYNDGSEPDGYKTFDFTGELKQKKTTLCPDFIKFHLILKLHTDLDDNIRNKQYFAWFRGFRVWSSGFGFITGWCRIHVCFWRQKELIKSFYLILIFTHNVTYTPLAVPMLVENENRCMVFVVA